MKKVPAKRSKSTALVSMADIEKMYAVESKAAAEAAPISGGVPIISTKGEQFQIGETILPDELQLVVVAEGLLNTYYDSEYDSANPMPPACFAVAVADKGVEQRIVSHELSPDRQGGTDFKCSGCEMNQFGSAEKGKGKACQNYRRLCVVFAEDPALNGQGDLKWGYLNLSPTALGDWGKFVQGLDRAEHRPPHGCIIRFTFDRKNPDAQKRKRVIAVGYQLIRDVAIATKINNLRKEIIESGALTRPLPVDGYVPPDARKGRHVEARGRASRKPAAKTTRPRAAPRADAKPSKKQAAGAARKAGF